MPLDLQEILKKFEIINIHSEIEPNMEEYFKREEEYFINARDTLSSAIEPFQKLESQRQSITEKYRKGEYLGAIFNYSSYTASSLREKIIETSFWYIKLITEYYSKKMGYEVNQAEVYNKLDVVEKGAYSVHGLSGEEREKYNEERHRKNKKLLDKPITYKQIIAAIHDSFNGLSLEEIKVQKTIEEFKRHLHGITYKVDKIQFKDCFYRSNGYRGHFSKQDRFDKTLGILSYYLSGSFELIPAFNIRQLTSPSEMFALQEIPLEHEKLISCRYLRTGVFEITFVDAETAEEFYIKFCSR